MLRKISCRTSEKDRSLAAIISPGRSVSIVTGKRAAYQESDRGCRQKRRSWIVFDQTLDVRHHAVYIVLSDVIRSGAKFVGSRMCQGRDLFSAGQILRMFVKCRGGVVQSAGCRRSILIDLIGRGATQLGYFVLRLGSGIRYFVPHTRWSRIR